MRNATIVLIVCLAALAIRLLLAAQATTFAPDAYDTIRQAEHIAQTGLPFKHDPLLNTSPATTLPVFPYLIAFGSIILGTYAYTVIPNALAVLLHAAIFYFVLEITQHRGIATTALIASTLVPGYVAMTLLTVSPLALAIPLIVTTLTLFIKLRKSKEKRNTLLAFTVLALATHPVALLLVPVFAIATALATIRRSRERTIHYEFTLFTTFFATWAYLLLFKQEIARFGARTIIGNAPAEVFAALYGAPDLLTFGLVVGVVPFGLAIYAAYKEGVSDHGGVQVALAFAIVAVAAATLKVVPTATGVTMVAIACTALAAVGLEWILTLLARMRTTSLPTVLASTAIIIFALTSAVPAVVAAAEATTNVVPPGSIEAGKWLRENSLPTATVVTEPLWGDAISWASGRPSLVDNDYFDEGDAEETLETIQGVLSGEEHTNVVNGMKIEYLITATRIEHACVNRVYGDDIRVYKVLC